MAMSKREVAGGIEPNLLSGRATGAQSRNIITAEVVRDMQDPRYKTDSAFRQDVEAKLARSTVI